MSAPPLPFVFDGKDGWICLRPKIAAQHYGAGEVVTLVRHEERSDATHGHQFAWLREAWLNLPESLADEYPSVERLRKRALIATGWCAVRDYVCTGRKEAERLAAALRGEVDEYAVVIVSNDVVRVCRAKSQAKNKMKAADFQASKTAILEWVAALVGTTPEQLQQNAKEVA